jgi:surfactin synthase thioesterase subunit
MERDGRTEAGIRHELGEEREQLVDAIADLRAAVAAKRASVAIVGGALAAATAVAVARRLTRR